MNTSTTRLRDMWMWQRPLMKAWVSVLVLVPIVAGCVLYPFLGPEALVAFSFAGIGVIGWVVYSWVGNKVERIRRRLTVPDGEVVEGLIVNGIIQSPGVVILRSSEVELIPIVGGVITVPFSEISSLRLTRWFNGVYYKWKTGVWLVVAGRQRLGFAVATNIAYKWQGFLTSENTSAQEPTHNQRMQRTDGR